MCFGAVGCQLPCTTSTWDCTDCHLGPGGCCGFPCRLPGRLSRRHPHLPQALLPCSNVEGRGLKVPMRA